MKNLLIILSVLLSLILTSCNDISTDREDISTKEKLQFCINKAKEEFKEDQFIGFTIYTDANRDCQWEMLSLQTTTKTKTFLGMTSQVTESDNIIDKSDLSPKKLDEIDCAFIIQKFKEAQKVILEESSEFEKFKLSEVSVDVSDDNQLTYSIEVFASQKEVKPIVSKGQRIRPKEPRFTFDISISKDGEVSLK